jgi:serine/threonine-protein kinase
MSDRESIGMSRRDILHYHLGDALGESPRGTTFTALDSGLQRVVAIKILAPGKPIDFERRGRFLDLMDDLAQLQHPGLSTVYSLEQVDDEIVLVREYVEGLSLRATLGLGPFLYSRCLAIAGELAAAVAEVHARGAACGLLHANNVIIAIDGRARIVDFALPVDTDFSTIDVDDPLCPAVAPELRKGSEPEASTDLYALGVIIYEMLAGKPPAIDSHGGSLSVQALPYELPSGEPMPSEARLLLERLLEPNPSERMPTIHELMATLEGMVYFLQHPPHPEEDKEGRGFRGRRALLLSAVAALLLVVWFVVTVFGD